MCLVLGLSALADSFDTCGPDPCSVLLALGLTPYRRGKTIRATAVLVPHHGCIKAVGATPRVGPTRCEKQAVTLKLFSE